MGLVKTAVKEIGVTGLIGDAINVGVAASDYKNARQQGNSKPVSLAKSAASFAWGEFFYGGLSRIASNGLKNIGIKGIGNMVGSIGITIGATALISSGQVIAGMGQHTAKTMNQGYNQRGKLGSGYFEMSQAGYTMRQRSLNAIRSNGINTQSVLGNEARTYYRGSM